MKKIISLFAIFIIMLSSYAYSATWKVVKEVAEKDMKVFIHKKVRKNKYYITYSLRYKGKDIGDYINVVYADCVSANAVIVETLEYTGKYKPKYGEYKECVIPKTDKDSILYKATKQACACKSKYFASTSDNNKVNFRPYMENLQKKIKSNWNPPKGEESSKIIVLFSISKDGNLQKVKIVKSSGSQLADRAAISAVEMTAPFEPLPKEYLKESVDIQFTFDYNVYNK